MDVQEIAGALRAGLAGHDVCEVKMFGGICFMVNGNMLAGTFRGGLLARVGAEGQAEALAQPGTSLMEMRGRPMEGYVIVPPEVLDDQAIREWIARARLFVETLPTKPQKVHKERKKQ